MGALLWTVTHDMSIYYIYYSCSWCVQGSILLADMSACKWKKTDWGERYGTVWNVFEQCMIDEPNLVARVDVSRYVWYFVVEWELEYIP